MRLIIIGLLLASSASFAEVSVSVRFTVDEVCIIADWYHDQAGVSRKGKGKDKGNGGRKGLPPGIAKNLARGKALPPGIAMQSLPAPLVAQLPPAPDGYQRVVIDGRVLLVEIATRVIHDMLEDLVLG